MPPICRWALPLPALAPVTAHSIDTALGTNGLSGTAFIHICRKRRCQASGVYRGKALAADPCEDPPITENQLQSIYRAPKRPLLQEEWCLPMWQVSPCHPTGQRQWPGRMQLPPFPHGGWHIAVGRRGLSVTSSGGSPEPCDSQEGLTCSEDALLGG